MCTWCPADVMCDLSIRECVSGLYMCPSCRCAMTAGSVVRVRGPCWSPLSCVFTTVAYLDGSLRYRLPLYSRQRGHTHRQVSIERGERRCALPRPSLRVEGGLYASPPPQLDWCVGLYHEEMEAVCCHAEIDWYESFPPRARWALSFCMARFFKAVAAGVCVALILCINQSAVSLGWF